MRLADHAMGSERSAQRAAIAFMSRMLYRHSSLPYGFGRGIARLGTSRLVRASRIS
jgi:hypothetical protein